MTYRINRVHTEQDPNDWEENAHGVISVSEIRVFFMSIVERIYEQQKIIAYGCSMLFGLCASTTQNL
jgi:hypothetical protein